MYHTFAFRLKIRHRGKQLATSFHIAKHNEELQWSLLRNHETSFTMFPEDERTAGCDVMSWMGAFVGSLARDYKVLSRMNDV